MLNVRQLSEKIDELAADRVSVYDFERWFRTESKDFHQWADARLKDAVFSIEAALSEYHFAELEESKLKVELSAAVCPLVAYLR
ncbi:MAG TPA: hypothetical protein DEQ47_10865 [Solibacterales bacterium]|nr:hypothetical protein [Bryobacterales bacterium]